MKVIKHLIKLDVFALSLRTLNESGLVDHIMYIAENITENGVKAEINL